MKEEKMSRRASLLCGAVAGVIASMLVGGLAWAAIPGAGGVIQGCYKEQNGQLRLVESATACNPSELPINWNQVGPTGPTGPSGPSGPSGPTGSSGISNYQIVEGTHVIALFDFGSADATCPAGTKPIGGGASFGLAPDTDAGYLEQSRPTATGWHARAHNVGPFVDITLTAFAICATVS